MSARGNTGVQDITFLYSSFIVSHEFPSELLLSSYTYFFLLFKFLFCTLVSSLITADIFSLALFSPPFLLVFLSLLVSLVFFLPTVLYCYIFSHFSVPSFSSLLSSSSIRLFSSHLHYSHIFTISLLFIFPSTSYHHFFF